MSVVDKAVKAVAEDHRLSESLAEKYIGKAALAFGRGIKDSWIKKQWYANRIKDLGEAEGHNAMMMRRCKSVNSPIYKKRQQVEIEIQKAADHLILELLMI